MGYVFKAFPAAVWRLGKGEQERSVGCRSTVRKPLQESDMVETWARMVRTWREVNRFWKNSGQGSW